MLNQDSPSPIVDASLQRIAKGTAIMFFSILLAMLFGIVAKLIIARSFSQEQYGIFILANTILSFCVLIATLGIDQTSVRQIAYYMGKDNPDKVRVTISLSLYIPLIVSIVILLTLFFAAGEISSGIFHETGLTMPLKILALAVPFSIVVSMLSAIFQGFNEVKPRVYYQNILRNGLLPLLVLPVVLLSLPFIAAIYAASISVIVTGIIFTIYTLLTNSFSMNIRFDQKIAKELLVFSLPVLGISALSFVFDSTSVLLLGYFKNTESIGLYSSALSLAKIITIVLDSMIFMYTPILSALYALSQMNEMKRIYQVLTKWISFVAFPIFLILILFPESMLTIFFGAKYAGATMALRILSLGFFLHTFFGANGMTLLVMGKTRILLLVNLLVACLNIILDLVLIPQLDVTGAAIAALVSFAVLNILFSVYLYKISNIQPFTINFIKPILASGASAVVIWIITRSLVDISIWILPLVLALFMCLYFVSLILTRSFDKEDIVLMSTLERGLGIKSQAFTNILRRIV